MIQLLNWSLVFIFLLLVLECLEVSIPEWIWALAILPLIGAGMWQLKLLIRLQRIPQTNTPVEQGLARETERIRNGGRDVRSS